MQENGKVTRFPWAAALLCAACVGAAGWTWMRYSYAWDVRERRRDPYRAASHLWSDEEYVAIRGTVHSETLRPADSGKGYLIRAKPDTGEAEFLVRLDSRPEIGAKLNINGRVLFQDGGDTDIVDAARSRFHGASIAGLVVGAMGVVVFALHLRHWLKERRAPGPSRPPANIG